MANAGETPNAAYFFFGTEHTAPKGRLGVRRQGAAFKFGINKLAV